MFTDTEKLLAVVVLVGVFAILVRMLFKIDRNSLEIEIRYRQKDLGKPVLMILTLRSTVQSKSFYN